MKRKTDPGTTIIFRLVCLGGIFLLVVYPSILLQTTYCEIWRWLAALVLIIGPWGSTRLGSQKKYSWPQIIIIMLSVHALFYIAYCTSVSYLSALYLETTYIPLNTLNVDYVWFWPFIITFACILAFYNYCLKKNNHKSMFSELYYSVINELPFHWFYISINGLTRYTIMGCFAMISALLVLALTRSTLGADIGVHFSALINATFISHITQRNLIKKIQKPMLRWHANPALHFFILLGLITLAYGIIYNLLSLAYPHFISKSYLHYAPTVLRNYAQHNAINYFWLGWWLSFTPILVGWITICCQGYTIRQTLITYLTPIVIIKLLPLSGGWPLSTHTNQILVIITLSVICLIFIRQQYIPSLYRATLPVTTIYTTPGHAPTILMFLNLGGKAMMILFPFGPKLLGLLLLMTGMLFYLFTYPIYFIFGMVLYRYRQGKEEPLVTEYTWQIDTSKNKLTPS